MPRPGRPPTRPPPPAPQTPKAKVKSEVDASPEGTPLASGRVTRSSKTPATERPAKAAAAAVSSPRKARTPRV
jgi:hypothetical protein